MKVKKATRERQAKERRPGQAVAFLAEKTESEKARDECQRREQAEKIGMLSRKPIKLLTSNGTASEKYGRERRNEKAGRRFGERQESGEEGHAAVIQKIELRRDADGGRV